MWWVGAVGLLSSCLAVLVLSLIFTMSVVVELAQLLAGRVNTSEFRPGRQSGVSPIGPFQNCNGFLLTGD